MTYQEFISETLKAINVIPTKDEMQFAYVVLYQALGLEPVEAVKESINLSL
jgi:hypothetical protein|tara:strand:- start:2338 stop:2490 length:153 start_codon:yes stop_codon:yes gene_type:complete